MTVGEASTISAGGEGDRGDERNGDRELWED